MKPGAMLLFITLATVTAAHAAESSERTSPVDRNAACMDRNVDASSGKCVLKDEGAPRRTYPPNGSPTPGAPGMGGAAPAAPAATIRNSGGGK